MAKSRSDLGKMSRRKGLNYENRICRVLSAWSSSDFARRGVGFSDKDIIVPEWFGFTIECKKVEGIKPQDLMKGFPLSGSLKDYWEQATDQAKKDKRTPMLIFSKNHEGVDYIVTLKETLEPVLVQHKVPHTVVLGHDQVYYVVVTLQELTKLDANIFKCS